MTPDIPRASQNQLKTWSKLADAKYRAIHGEYLAEGVKVVSELVRAGLTPSAFLVMPEKERLWSPVGIASDVPVYGLTRPQWKKISQEKEPEGIAAVMRHPAETDLSTFLNTACQPIVLVHAINNPANLGAVIRSAHWFGFAGMLIGSGSVDPYHPKVIRTSMGSIFHVPMFANLDLPSVIDEVASRFTLIGSDAGRGTPPGPTSGKTALLLGSESHGLPDELSSRARLCWRISGSAGAESLSLPQAAAIMMYEMTRNSDPL